MAVLTKNPHDNRQWLAEIPDGTGQAKFSTGATKSEARARLKKALGLKSLPPRTRLTWIA